MKNIPENKVNIWVEKYKYNTLLTLVIFILFLLAGYSNSKIDYKLYVNNQETSLKYGIYTNNNEQYIHIDDLTDTFKDNIVNDKISGNIIITTYDKLTKIKKNDENYVITKDSDIYFNLQKIISEIGNIVSISKDKIYVSNEKHIEGTILVERTELYDKIDGNIIDLLEKNAKVKVQIDESLLNSLDSVVNVVTTDNKYGYILKNNIQYEYETTDEQEYTQQKILVKAENKLMSSTDMKKIDMIAINMYRLSGVNSLTKLEYLSNVSGKVDVFGTINNGQKSSNFDSDITTGMLNSSNNRYEIIQDILNGVKNIAGANIDFGNLKTTDKDNFTQFIKELAAILHANDKQLIVNVPSTQYIEISEIVKAADYVIIQPYTARTLASKTSGPISSITYVEDMIKSIEKQKIDMTKVILEIPAYSILWTERKGTVINAEQYSMKAMQLYLTSNNIQSTLDSTSGQNYINYTKGITTYKMWLEDEYSVIAKTKLAKKYNLAGVSIYKSGMELEGIYKNISSNLNK